MKKPKKIKRKKVYLTFNTDSIREAIYEVNKLLNNDIFIFFVEDNIERVYKTRWDCGFVRR